MDIQRVYVGVLKVQGVQKYWTDSFMVVEFMFHLFCLDLAVSGTIFADIFLGKRYHRKISDYSLSLRSFIFFFLSCIGS